MATFWEKSDRITLSRVDVRVLVALLQGPETAYGIARRCETDSGHTAPLSNSVVYTAISRLERLLLVRLLPERTNPSRRAGKYFKISPLGRQTLRTELASLRELIDVGSRRLDL